VDQQRELVSTYAGIFNGFIGIFDVNEVEIGKQKDHVEERRSYSSKKKKTVTTCYQWWTTMDVSSIYRSLLVRMIEKFSLIANIPLRFTAADGAFKGKGRSALMLPLSPGLDETQ
jgi:hypothetical protein